VTYMPNSIRVAHLSDTHLGYEAYKPLNVSGENQRAADFARAFVNVCREIIAADPDVVIHSGDVADRTHIPIRVMLLIRYWFSQLAGVRPDGTRRQLVVVAGNHELPRNKKEACFLELFRGLPGVHIVTQGYEQIRFEGQGASEGCSPILNNLVVHAIPHDALKTVDFDLVNPVEDFINIFSSHGVAGGSELYVRSLGREFAIPTDVLARDWDYGALGHWHKQGPVPIVSTGARTDGIVRVDADGRERNGRIWYSGSTENSGFGDLLDNGEERGWLDVLVQKGDLPAVKRCNVPIRVMVRLPKADLTGLTPDEITNLLIENIRAAQTNSSVVGQIVENVSRETWSLVDLQTVRAAASGALHYDVTVRHSRNTEQCGDEHRGLSEVDTVLVERANVLLLDSEREQALELARSLLARELARVDADPTAESAEAIANNSTRRVRKGAQNRPVSTQGTGLVTTPANETGHTIVGGHK
jgi:DNA repair exonuclease SbcCD nuclease subunit